MCKPVAPDVFTKAFSPNISSRSVSARASFTDGREISARGWIEIEENVVRMLLIVVPARPGIMVDTAEIRQVQQRRQIVREEIMDL